MTDPYARQRQETRDELCRQTNRLLELRERGESIETVRLSLASLRFVIDSLPSDGQRRQAAQESVVWA